MNRFDRLPHIEKRLAARAALYAGTEFWPDTTLQQAILDGFESKPEQNWIFVKEGEPTRLTLGELADASHAFARELLATDANTPDDVVAIVLPNSAGAVAAFWGGQLAGISGFPTSMREGEDSLRELFDMVGISHLVIADDDQMRRGWAEKLIGDGTIKYLWLSDARGQLRSPDPKWTPAPEVELPVTTDGVHIVAYTSGSTSTPKVVLHTDTEILAESHSLAEVFGFFDTIMVAAPVGHITGILHLLTLPLVRPGDVVSLDRWTVEAGLDACRRFGAQTVAGTSLYFQQMMDADPVMGGLQGGIAGGGPVAPIIVQRAYREAGIRIVRSYGSTEHPTISQSLPSDPVEKRALTDGRLNKGVEIRILDPEGNPVQPGTSGEIISRGPDVMAGYLDPVLDAEFFPEDGWFRTGDVGFMDADGFLTLTDRIKDLIIRAGENISAKEVEDVLHQWDAIAEVVVVGVPDAQYGERACAFIIPNRPGITLDGLREYLAGTRLEKFKWPEHIALRDTLPRTPSGKVSKQVLRQEWAAETFAS